MELAAQQHSAVLNYSYFQGYLGNPNLA